MRYFRGGFGRAGKQKTNLLGVFFRLLRHLPVLAFLGGPGLKPYKTCPVLDLVVSLEFQKGNIFHEEKAYLRVLTLRTPTPFFLSLFRRLWSCEVPLHPLALEPCAVIHLECEKDRQAEFSIG
jgi:hypothetical protein